jgi:hypothetical protein
LSSDTETVTVNLAAEATIDSYYLRVKPYIGGTIENLTNMNMAYLDSFDFEVDTTSSLTLYLVIIAADNASLTFSTMISGLAFTESPSGSGHYHINLTIGDIMAYTPAFGLATHWLNFALLYAGNTTVGPITNIVRLVPNPVGLSQLIVNGDPVSLTTAPYEAYINCTDAADILAQFIDLSGASIATSVDIAIFPLRDLGGTTFADALWYDSMNVSAGTWSATIDSSYTGILNNWKAGKEAGILLIVFQVTDQLGNVFVDCSRMPVFNLRLVDERVNYVNKQQVEDYALNVLDRSATHKLFVTVNVDSTESYIRSVIMYYHTAPVASNTVSGWIAAGAKTMVFSLVSLVDNEWMVVIPVQDPSTMLYWAFFVEDYAGNNNANNLTRGTNPLVFSPVSAEETMQEPIGYVLIGVLAFGLVFAVSYRVHVSVQSVKKAKKISAAVKKAAPGKTIGGTSKTPISKDIPTKVCPICKAKIGADLGECPYCHKKF